MSERNYTVQTKIQKPVAEVFDAIVNEKRPQGLSRQLLGLDAYGDVSQGLDRTQHRSSVNRPGLGVQFVHVKAI